MGSFRDDVGSTAERLSHRSTTKGMGEKISHNHKLKKILGEGNFRHSENGWSSWTKVGKRGGSKREGVWGTPSPAADIAMVETCLLLKVGEERDC